MCVEGTSPRAIVPLTTMVKSVEVAYLFFLNRGTLSSAVSGFGAGLVSVH